MSEETITLVVTETVTHEVTLPVQTYKSMSRDDLDRMIDDATSGVDVNNVTTEYISVTDREWSEK